MAYIRTADAGDCVFCERRDAPPGVEVIARSAHVYTILNAYPYAPGHLMVCPFRHVGSFGALTPDERRELLHEARRASAALRSAYAPEVIHLGANTGRPAGAGVIGHFHLHLVPLRDADHLDDPDRPGIDEAPETLEETRAKLVRALGGA